MAEVLFFSQIGCRLWAALLNSSSPPNPYRPNARRSYAYCLGAVVVGPRCRYLALAGCHPRTPARGPQGALGQRSSGDVEQPPGRGGVVPPLGTGAGLAQRRSVGGDRTPPAGPGRHHTDPLRAAARPLDQGGYPRSGEDTVEDAVRNRRPHQRGSGPQRRGPRRREPGGLW